MYGLVGIVLFVMWIFQNDNDVLLLATGLFAIADAIDTSVGRWFKSWEKLIERTDAHV